MTDAATSLSLLIDVNFLLINRIVVLAVTLLFFSVVMTIRRSRGQVIGSNIITPIKLSLFGMLLLVGEMALNGIPNYRAMLEGIQTIVVLLCAAKLAMYLAVDIYLRLHIQGNIPSFLRDAARLVVYLSVGIISLRLVFKIDISTIVTTTTVITATIAFAMQSTLSNALSGFSIQTDRLLNRHNWIAITEKNIFGEIVNVGFRYTTLRSLNNTLLLVPNSVIMQSVVTYYGNSESNEKAEVNTEVMLGYDMPPQLAKELLCQVLSGDPLVLANPQPVVRLKSLDDNGIIYQMNFRINDPSKKSVVQDNLYTQLWYAVTREGFSFPFPHREIITSESRVPFAFSCDQIGRDLQDSDLFSMLDDDTLAALAAKTPIRVYGPGETVVRQGENGSSLYIVLKGTLGVELDGKPVGSISQDSFFGEMSLLTGEPRLATVRADSEVWLAEITKVIIEPLLRENPEVLEKISAVLASRRHAADELARNDAESAGESPRSEDYLQRLKQFFMM